MVAHAGKEMSAEHDRWALVQCARLGAPPLRFYAERLDQVEVPRGEGAPLHLTLYARRSGGFCVCYSCWTEHGWQMDAFKADTVLAAIEALEDYCAEITKPAPSDTATGQAFEPALGMVFIRHARAAAEIERFKNFVGAALCRWMRFAQPEPQARHAERSSSS